MHHCHVANGQTAVYGDEWIRPRVEIMSIPGRARLLDIKFFRCFLFYDEDWEQRQREVTEYGNKNRYMVHTTEISRIPPPEAATAGQRFHFDVFRRHPQYIL